MKENGSSIGLHEQIKELQAQRNEISQKMQKYSITEKDQSGYVSLFWAAVEINNQIVRLESLIPGEDGGIMKGYSRKVRSGPEKNRFKNRE